MSSETAPKKNKLTNGVKKISAVAGIAFVGATGVAGCEDNGNGDNADNQRAAVAVSKAGLIVSEPGIIVRETLGTSPNSTPYKVTIDPSEASSELKDAFAEDPCTAVLGEYSGKIACTQGDSAVELDQLPNELEK